VGEEVIHAEVKPSTELEGWWFWAFTDGETRLYGNTRSLSAAIGYLEQGRRQLLGEEG
jgi:hypothetical protein